VISKVSSRPRSGLRIAAVLACLIGLAVAVPASAAQILEVVLDPERTGVLRVGVRDAGDEVPRVTVAEAAIDVALEGRETSVKWQPLFMIVDTTNIEEERLDKVKTNITGLATREFKIGSRMVVISDHRGVGVEATSLDSVDGAIKTTLEAYKVIPNPDRGRKPKPHYSTISPFLKQRLSNVPVSRAQPWALVFSSLCVAPDDEPSDSLKSFKGPIRFLTWDRGLQDKCIENREVWLGKLRAIRDVEVYNLDDPAQSEAIKQARMGRTDVKDEIVTLTGVPYGGELLKLTVGLKGIDPWTNTFKEDTVPPAWAAAADAAQAQKVRIGAAIGFGILVIMVILVALVKARSGGLDVAKWEAVGEAEDLSSSMDPDAWNATIFQLTGAMPALKEVRQAAQLGPSDAAAGGAAIAPPPPEAEGASETSSSPSIAAPTGDLPSTGMTVAMPVLDDGTGYDAELPFEIGVLHGGRPVARKTKKFRKVFSIGRATDNRVVIQKDDTVHRYHVVVRPALEGKEWWLEVSPTSTNRTNLNGKDLRPGGRYRLPARFRLQLGEATEVRGRLSKDAS
jgi:hypothetical protein